MYRALEADFAALMRYINSLFTYLHFCAVVTSDAEYTTDIHARLNKGQGIVSSFRKIW